MNIIIVSISKFCLIYFIIYSLYDFWNFYAQLFWFLKLVLFKNFYSKLCGTIFISIFEKELKYKICLYQVSNSDNAFLRMKNLWLKYKGDTQQKKILIEFYCNENIHYLSKSILKLKIKFILNIVIYFNIKFIKIVYLQEILVKKKF